MTQPEKILVIRPGAFHTGAEFALHALELQR